MPNQPSPESRRVCYVEDRETFEHLEKIATKQSVTVGELIRRATAEKYFAGALDKKSGLTSVAARLSSRREEEKPAAANRKGASKTKAKAPVKAQKAQPKAPVKPQPKAKAQPKPQPKAKAKAKPAAPAKKPVALKKVATPAKKSPAKKKTVRR